jgi:hypothetical protein
MQSAIHMCGTLSRMSGKPSSSTLTVGFYCYRAIESMRQQCLEGDEENDAARKQSWQRLRDVLGVSKADIDVIKEAAKSRRHGGAESVSYAERIEHVKWTRDLLLRFVEALPQAGPNLAQLDV